MNMVNIEGHQVTPTLPTPKKENVVYNNLLNKVKLDSL